MSSGPVMSQILAEFSRSIAGMDVTPLWEREAGAMSPGTKCVPQFWRYSDLRPSLMKSIELISKRDAERRVLVLENPSLRGTTYITNTLYAGLQVIAPGEIAPSHRHTPNALRFVIEGQGAYTSVDGERVVMHPGDFIVTPNWTWHDHGNLGTAPVVWLDGLDTPFGKMFGSMFREDLDQESQLVTREEGEALASFGSNMLPVDYVPGAAHTPILKYPYDRTREALARLSTAGRFNPAQGAKLRYVNPATGKYPFSTMAVFMQMLPSGFEGKSYRSTDGTVFVVVEGEGTFTIGGHRYEFGVHDIFVAPPWEAYNLSASSETVLFSYSDRAAQDALGFWKEELVTNV